MTPKRSETLPIEIFRTIVAVAETGSYRAAAARLGISNPAVNAQLERLKRIIGSDIFRREVDAVVPTDTGSRVIGAARQILALHDQLFVEVDENR